jgi:hypothetical protein
MELPRWRIDEPFHASSCNPGRVDAGTKRVRLDRAHHRGGSDVARGTAADPAKVAEKLAREAARNAALVSASLGCLPAPSEC